jgi:hypothetical protein
MTDAKGKGKARETISSQGHSSATNSAAGPKKRKNAPKQLPPPPSREQPDRSSPSDDEPTITVKLRPDALGDIHIDAVSLR